MKNALQLTLLMFLLSGCGTSKLVQLSGQTSKEGILVAQNGVDAYTLLAQQPDIDVQQQNMTNILTVANPASLVYTPDPPNPVAREIAPRVQAYKSLIAAYEAFVVLANGKYSDDTKTAVTALETSYSNFKSLPGLSSATSSAIATAATKFMTAIQSKAIKKHNEALSTLTKVAMDLWNEEAPAWDRYIGLVYDTYARQVMTYPAKNYDMAKVKAAVNGPYTGDAVLLQLYRVSQVAAVVKQKNELKKALANFGKALTLIKQAHAELSKDQTDTSSAVQTLNTIETLLASK